LRSPFRGYGPVALRWVSKITSGIPFSVGECNMPVKQQPGCAAGSKEDSP
jgi:hypothetical protein